MENPYGTPESKLDPRSEYKRPTWWILYFFSITIMSFIGMISYLMDDGVGLVDYFEFILLFIATAGLFGFVFSKKVFFREFWQPFLMLYLISSVVYEPLSNVDMRLGMSDIEWYISLAIGILISIPAYLGLYRYGKKNEKIWSTT